MHFTVYTIRVNRHNKLVRMRILNIINITYQSPYEYIMFKIVAELRN